MNAPKRIQTMTLWILRYDKAEWNSLITLLFARLFVLVSGTHCCGPLPRSLVHLPALMGECHISAVMQRPTNRLRWERLGSMVGTLLPSFLSLPGNRCRLREGPPAACCLNKGQTKTLATRQVTRVNVVSPPYFFINGGTLLYLLAGLEKKEYMQSHRKKTHSKVWELFLFSFFFFQELLSVLTLLTQVFVHLWHRIRGSTSSLCVKISTTNYI